MIVWYDKWETVTIEASSLDKAYLKLFDKIDNMGYYFHVELNEDEKRFYNKAKFERNSMCAIQLLYIRKNANPWENFEVIQVAQAA